MCQQFRFASEGQLRSSRLLAECSPVCKHRLCRFGSNAVVMSRAAGSDDQHLSGMPDNRSYPGSRIIRIWRSMRGVCPALSVFG